MGREAVSGASRILKRLKAGNDRFSRDRTMGPGRDRTRRIELRDHGQAPGAIVLACSDSRVPPEIILDQGLGDLFVVRVAGNVADVSGMGSIEYGVEHLRIPLLIVMGHTNCGAVTAVTEGQVVSGHLQTLAGRIEPAVEKARVANPDLNPGDLTVEAIRVNVWLQMENLFQDSPVIRRAAAEGRLEVWGAEYKMGDGLVTWLGRYPPE